MDFQTSDKMRLNYHKYGKGQPLVFIHGYSGYQEIWTMQIDFFVNHGYQVITYDQRNHGASQFDPNLTDFNVLIRDLKELIIGLKLDQPILIGHSMGAAVVYGFIGKYASMIKAAVAVDESPKMIGTPDFPYGFMNATRINYKEKLAQLGKVRETLHGVAPKCRQAVKNARAQFPFNWEGNQKLLYGHVHEDWRQNLINATLPVLLVTANQSPFYNGKWADVMVKQNPKYLKHVAIDQSGHCVMAEQPAEFNQTVLKFITALS